jgi:hypothetical protein
MVPRRAVEWQGGLPDEGSIPQTCGGLDPEAFG